MRSPVVNQYSKFTSKMMPALSVEFVLSLIVLSISVWNIVRWVELDCSKEPVGKCRPPRSIDDFNDYNNAMFGLSIAAILCIILMGATKYNLMK